MPSLTSLGIDSLSLLTVSNLLLAALFARSTYRQIAHRRRANAAERHNADLIERLSEGIYRSSLDGRQLSANPALVKLNGYETETEMLAAVNDIAVEWYVQQGRRDEFRDLLHSVGNVEDFVSEIYRHKTRERIWITESARIVCDRQTGRPLFYEGSVRDISEAVEHSRLEAMFRKLGNRVPGSLFQLEVDATGAYAVNYLSEGFERVMGLSRASVVETPTLFTSKVHPADRERFTQSFHEAHTALGPWEHEFRIIDDGLEKWLRVTAEPEKLGDSVLWHGYLADVSARKRHEIHIENEVYVDALTGLANRRRFFEFMQHEMSRARAIGTHGALLFVDLDGFKRLNDTRGHAAGDACLRMVGRALRADLSHNELAARIGGDEFVMAIDGGHREPGVVMQTAIRRANQLLAAFRHGCIHSDAKLTTNASIGIVLFDGSEDSADDVLKCADQAMYQAKAAGRDGIALYGSGGSGAEIKRSAAHKSARVEPRVDDQALAVGQRRAI